jgi:hypothetical protein
LKIVEAEKVCMASPRGRIRKPTPAGEEGGGIHGLESLAVADHEDHLPGRSGQSRRGDKQNDEKGGQDRDAFHEPHGVIRLAG